jgi:hypothetical protein
MKMSSTPMSKVSGSSMWYPQEKGNNTTMWKGWDNKGNMSKSMGGFENKDPGKKMKSYDKTGGTMGGSCPGCGH